MTDNIGLFGADNYREFPSRIVLFKYKRYRVCIYRGETLTTWQLWYSGQLIKIGDREGVITGFKKAIHEIKEMLADDLP